MSRHNYTPEQEQFILDHYEGITTKALVDLFNKKFGTNLPGWKIKNYKARHNLSNGLDNSGMTQEQKTWIKKHYKGISTRELTELFNFTFNTSFKPSKIRDYKKHLGLHSGYTYQDKYRTDMSEKKYQNGLTYIKVNGEFIAKQRYLYEKHIGEIPPGYAVIFKDGNKDNFDLSNLVLVERKLLCTVLSDLTNDPDINESILLLGKVRNKTRKIEKELLC